MGKKKYIEPTRKIKVSMIDDILLFLDNYAAMLSNEGITTEEDEVDNLIYNIKVIRF